MVQKISKIKIALAIILGIFCLPFFSSADIQTIGQLYWPESYIASNSGMPDAHGGTNVNKYTYASTFTANLGFALDLNSNNLLLSKSDGALPVILSNTLGEWFTGATFAATPIIKYGNEWSSMGYSEPADPKAEVPRGSPYCCSWNAGACPGLTSSSFVAFKCSRSSVTATSSNPSIASVNLVGTVGTQKIQVGTTTVTFTHCYSTGGSTVYCDPVSQTNPDSFYYPENQQIDINPLSEGATDITINANYSCKATLTDNYCSYRLDPGVWEYLYYNVAATDVPQKTLTLSKVLNISVSDDKTPASIVDINPMAVYNHSASVGKPNDYIDDITATINATDPDPGDTITEYAFEWYQIAPGSSVVTQITDGIFSTNGNTQTLLGYKALPTETLIFVRGRAKDSQGFWGDFAESKRVVVSPLAVSCSVSASLATIGAPVTWSASATGGDGTYSYLWNSDVIDGNGGVITHVGGNTIHTFTSSGIFNPGFARNIKVLVVGGGGAGARSGGGGGAGGFVANNSYSVLSQNYAVSVGAGGSTGQPGGNGQDSVFDTIVAKGGGGGGYYNGQVGIDGGSGGGGGAGDSTALGGKGTFSQGNNGGAGGGYPRFPSGGGGGAGGIGGNASGATGGAGGIGISSLISGVATYYAGGGGGSGDTSGTGGLGGGGNGAVSSNIASAAISNTGGGGGGSDSQAAGGAGGSGIVIISYPTSGEISGNSISNTVSYTSFGKKDAMVTVTSAGFSTTTVSCLNPGGTGGVFISAKSTCGSAVTSNNTEKPVSNLCLAGAPTEPVLVNDADTNISNWSWWCKNIDETDNVQCKYFFNSLDPALNCSLSSPASQSNINTNTAWTVTPPACPLCQKNWTITDSNGVTNPPLPPGNTLNKIFTTTGLKKVSVQFSSSTAYTNGNICSATTNVVQSGTIIEQ